MDSRGSREPNAPGERSSPPSGRAASSKCRKEVKLVFSSRFEEDFAELGFYFAGHRWEALAVRFENAVCELVELLLQNPEIGRSRKDLKPAGIRSLLVPEFRNYLL